MFSEIALVDILHMRQGPSGQQRVLSILDPGSKLQINLISDLGHLNFNLIDN